MSEPPCGVYSTFAKSPIGAEEQTVCREYGTAYSLLGEANDLIRWAGPFVTSEFMGEQGKAESF